MRSGLSDITRDDIIDLGSSLFSLAVFAAILWYGLRLCGLHVPFLGVWLVAISIRGFVGAVMD